MPGIYTVTEQAYDKYEPQETHRVTVVAGQVAKVTFNNKLKRGDLQVVKSSEDMMNCDTKRNKSQKTRAMALRQKLVTQRSMTYMSFGRI